MSDSTVWWILAGVLAALEMATGTFYLVMIAFGMVAAALAAHAGMSLTTQIVIAALVGGGATLGWHLLRSRRPPPPPANANPDINLDVGETVHVEAWNADGTATVRYRGASWTVVAAPGTTHGTGTHRVREVVGSRLVVEKT